MPSPIVLFPNPGCVVEFIESNKIVTAYVIEAQAAQLRLYTIGKREVKLSAARLLPWSGPAYGGAASRQEMEERLALHAGKRKALAEEIDVMQLWELAQGEVDKASVQWFAELLWPDADIDRLAALGQSLLNAKTHFKFNPPNFEIYPAELVEQKLQKAEADRKHEEIVSAGTLFLRNLWDVSNNRRPALTEAELPPANVRGLIERMLLDRLSDPDSTENDTLWKILIKSLPEDPHLPLLLAMAWGLKPPHYNFWLDRADYQEGEDWVRPLESDINALAANVRAAASSSGEEISGGFVSIDPSTTQDWDDAFKVEDLPGGGWRAVLALACPAAFWPFGSPLDQAVAYRASSIYLPEGSLHMMPRAVSLELFSLRGGERRTPLPALQVDIELDEDGKIRSTSPSFRWIRVAANLTHEDCEALLTEKAPEGNAAAPYGPMLESAMALSRVLQKRRIERGAVITEKPEPSVRLEKTPEGDILALLEPDLGCPLSQNLVGELMILCNCALAAWGTERGLPLLYRAQDIALPKEFAGVWTQPQDIFRVIKALPPATLELQPKPHAGLGAGIYATFTSPMRRYVDLINEAQIIRHLAENVPAFSAEELRSALTGLSERLAATGQVQRFRPRYWKLLSLQQSGQAARENGKPWREATVLEENDSFVTVNLECAQITLRAPRSRFHDKVYPGQSVMVRLAKINPLHNDMQIVEAMEN